MTAPHQPPMITCTCCAKSFEGFAPDQAEDCAATILADGVIGHYGSSVADMTRLAWVAGEMPAELHAGGTICDACITRMLEDNILEETHENRAAPERAPRLAGNWVSLYGPGAPARA